MAYKYTDEEFAEIKLAYANQVSLETLALKYNKSVASIRMKLVKAGVYQKSSATKQTSTVSKATKLETQKTFLYYYNGYGPAFL
jgi:hypothetical protein